MAVLDPVDIRQLASWLDDGTWLDLRVVDTGRIERCRVHELRIRREDEDVEFAREFPSPDGIVTQNFSVPADDIMYARPSAFEVEDVTAFDSEARRPDPPEVRNLGRGLDSADQALLTAIVNATAPEFGQSPRELRADLAGSPQLGIKGARVDRRHVVLWTLYEMSTLPVADCCWALGYKSQMPYTSMRWKLHSAQEPRRDLAKIIRRVYRNVINVELPNWVSRAERREHSIL